MNVKKLNKQNLSDNLNGTNKIFINSYINKSYNNESHNAVFRHLSRPAIESNINYENFI